MSSRRVEMPAPWEAGRHERVDHRPGTSGTSSRHSALGCMTPRFPSGVCRVARRPSSVKGLCPQDVRGSQVWSGFLITKPPHALLLYGHQDGELRDSYNRRLQQYCLMYCPVATARDNVFLHASLRACEAQRDDRRLSPPDRNIRSQPLPCQPRPLVESVTGLVSNSRSLRLNQWSRAVAVSDAPPLCNPHSQTTATRHPAWSSSRRCRRSRSTFSSNLARQNSSRVLGVAA